MKRYSDKEFVERLKATRDVNETITSMKAANESRLVSLEMHCLASLSNVP